MHPRKLASHSQSVTRVRITLDPPTLPPNRVPAPKGTIFGLLGVKPWSGSRCSARAAPADKKFEICERESAGDLCTPTTRPSVKLSSLEPLFSEALYFCPKIRFCKAKQLGCFNNANLRRVQNHLVERDSACPWNGASMLIQWR